MSCERSRADERARERVSERGKIVSEKSWIQITDSVSPFPLSFSLSLSLMKIQAFCALLMKGRETHRESEKR